MRSARGPRPKVGTTGGITVVIPLYNKSRSIGRALDSVVAQRLQPTECIIVDDGSVDGGAETARRILERSDLPFQLISTANQGPGAARNLGLHLAETQYVAFLDADDEWYPSFLEVTACALRSNPHAALATAAWDAIPSHGTLPHDGVGEGRLASVKGPTRHRMAMQRLNACHNSSVVARRAELIKAGGFYGNGVTFGEDSWLWSQFVLVDRVLFVQRSLLAFHSDFSELGVARQCRYPSPPLLTERRAWLRLFPAEHKMTAVGFLRSYYVDFVEEAARHGSLRLALQLIVRGYAQGAVLGIFAPLRAAARLPRAIALRIRDRLKGHLK